MASRTIFAPYLRLSTRTTPKTSLLSPSPIVPLSSSSRCLQTSATRRAEEPLSPPSPPSPPGSDPRRVPGAPDSPALKQNLSLPDRLLLRFREYLPNTTETYVAFEGTRDLYTECALQAAYADDAPLSPSAKFWYEGCGRTPSFSSWAHVTMLHMWMITVRMRALDPSRVGIWQQHFIDHFFYDSEDRMVKRYGVKAATARGNYMKDLYHQYRGMTAAFDEALMRGDAVMAAALWRNIFLGRDDVDIELLTVLTAYVRRVLSKLGQVDDEVLTQGQISFGLPLEEWDLVRQKSTYLEEEAKRLGPELNDKKVASANAA